VRLVEPEVLLVALLETTVELGVLDGLAVNDDRDLGVLVVLEINVHETAVRGDARRVCGCGCGRGDHAAESQDGEGSAGKKLLHSISPSK